MGKRWIMLVSIGVAVGVIDQWTKLLAVKHLTPSFAHWVTGSKKPMTPEDVERIVGRMAVGEQVSAFFSSDKHPCRAFGARCEPVVVVAGFWNWRYVENPGAAWGIMSKSDDGLRIPFFLIVPIAAVLFIIAFVRKLEDHQYLSITSMSLVFGGAIGNFIDRLHLTYVIDFIDWYVGTAHWPTFNFADAAISTGVALLMVEWLRDWIRSRSAGPEKATS